MPPTPRAPQGGGGAVVASSAAHAAARPVLRTLTALLKVCTARADLATGRTVHAQLAAWGLASESLAATAVANMYFNCRRPADAHRVFDRPPARDRIAWNALVARYARNGLPAAAMEAVVRMQGEEGWERPDSVTLVSVLPACADARALRACSEVHAFALRAELDDLVSVSTVILDAYCKCGAGEAARAVFHWMLFRISVSWNAMIDGYAENGNATEALALFWRMVQEGVDVMDASVLAALQAYGELGCLDEARRVHKLLEGSLEVQCVGAECAYSPRAPSARGQTSRPRCSISYLTWPGRTPASAARRAAAASTSASRAACVSSSLPGTATAQRDGKAAATSFSSAVSVVASVAMGVGEEEQRGDVAWRGGRVGLCG